MSEHEGLGGFAIAPSLAAIDSIDDRSVCVCGSCGADLKIVCEKGCEHAEIDFRERSRKSPVPRYYGHEGERRRVGRTHIPKNAPVLPAEKICIGCKNLLSIKNFSIDLRGYAASRCKECKSLRAKQNAKLKPVQS